MINTDKYEGHTPAPWELITNYSEENWDNKWVGSVHLFTTLGISFDVVGVNETDVQLIADAPLLLAAYDKQVRWINDILFRLEKMDEASTGQRLRFLLTVQDELEMMIK